MKGAFETALVLLFGMMFLLMGMDYVRLMLYNNRARLLAEHALAMVEHQNRYDWTVQQLIDQSIHPCAVCHLSIEPHEVYPERKWIIVSYPLTLAHLNVHQRTHIRLLTRPLN